MRVQADRDERVDLQKDPWAGEDDGRSQRRLEVHDERLLRGKRFDAPGLRDFRHRLGEPLNESERVELDRHRQRIGDLPPPERVFADPLEKT